ncbi:MAG: oligosaccharide flippase family protein [Candidatus Omnitrophica bacterium]|nr:oligosaccharide flippase family protein [Candidatus Omnitrophota bacterium]
MAITDLKENVEEKDQAAKRADGQYSTSQVQRRIVKDTSLFSFASIFSLVMSFFRGMVIPNLLGPVYYGMLNGLSVISNHTQYSHMGISNGMSFWIPHYRGKGDERAIEEVRNATFTVAVITGAFASALIFVILGIVWKRLDIPVRAGLGVFACLVFIQNLRIFINLALRSDHRFKLISLITMLESFFATGLVISLAWFFKIYGVFAAMLLSSGYFLLFSFVKAKYLLRWYMKKKVLLDLLSVGFPLFIIGLCNVFFLGIDRILIIKVLGLKNLGFYALGLTLATYLKTIPIAFSKIIAPRVYEESSREEGDTVQYLVDPVICLSLLAVTMIGFLYLIVPWFFSEIFPAYISGIRSGQILLISAYFPIVALIPSQIIIGQRRMAQVLVFQLLAIGVAFFFGLLAFKRGMGIEGMAAAMLLAHALYAVLALYGASRLTIKNRCNMLTFFASLSGIFCYGILTAYGLEGCGWFFGCREGCALVLKTLVFVAGLIPVYYVVSRRSWMFKEIVTLSGLGLSRIKNRMNGTTLEV